MKYHPPFDQQSVPNASYVNGNPGLGVAGSIPPAEQMEYPQREIVNAITLGGLTPDDADLYQLARAIRGGQLDFAFDTGGPDALVATIALAHNQIKAGLPFVVLKGANANVGTAPKLTIQGPSAANPLSQPIVKANGQPVAPGDLPANAMLALRSDGTSFHLLSLMTIGDVIALIKANTPVNLKINATLWFRSDGNDNNDGSANTPQSAFLTPQAAYNVAVRSYRSAGFTITLQCGTPGTYPGLIANNLGFTGTIVLSGDTSQGQAAQTSYVITPVAAGDGSFSCVLAGITTLQVQGVTLDASGLANGTLCNIMRAGGGGNLLFGNVTLRQSGVNTACNVLEIDAGGSAAQIGSVTANLGTVGTIILSSGNYNGVGVAGGATWTMSNATFGNFASVAAGQVSFQLTTFVGTNNAGARYAVLNATLLPPPAGLAAIPGNAAGTVALGTGYVPGDPGTPWTTYNTGLAVTSGSIGSASSTGRYQRIGRIVYFSLYITIGSASSGAGNIIAQLPFTPATPYAFTGAEVAANGKMISSRPYNSTGQVVLQYYDNSSTGVSGTTYVIAGCYEAQS